MQKTYWWRFLTVAFSVLVFGYGYIAVNLDGLGIYNSFIDPLMFLSLSLLAVSLFLFFVRDEVFKKWLKFSAAWFVFAILLISVTPASIHSFSPLAGPDRETVSIWMASLFVIISLAKISRDSRQRNSTSGFYSK